MLMRSASPLLGSPDFCTATVDRSMHLGLTREQPCRGETRKARGVYTQGVNPQLSPCPPERQLWGLLLYHSKKVPGGTEAPFASVIMSSLTRRFLAVPPALTFASPRVCFPGITWRTSCLLSVSCPVSVWKNPRKIRRQAGITNGRQGGRRGD